MTRKEEIWHQALISHKNCYDDYVNGAEWADEHPREGLVDIDKVYKWFEENLHMYNTSECKGDRIAFIEDFKKAMEE